MILIRLRPQPFSGLLYELSQALIRQQTCGYLCIHRFKHPLFVSVGRSMSDWPTLANGCRRLLGRVIYPVAFAPG